MRQAVPLHEKFEAQYVPEPNSGCWLWTGAVGSDKKPYGRLAHGGVTHIAHRVSYVLHRGPIPDGMYVCHRCDNMACVNPEHLFIGTPQDNNTDMVRKGRSASGLRNAAAKLTPDQVIAIRATPGKNRDLAVVFGVSYATIYQIRNRIIWKTI